VDFERIAVDTAKQVSEQVDYILGLNISPGDKQLQIAKLVASIGVVYHDQAYGAVSTALGSQAVASTGPIDTTDRSNRLAQKVVRNYSLGRAVNDRTIKSYFDSELGEVQDQAFKNAKSMEKHPTVVRSLSGKENCDWCENLAGRHTRPTGEAFARHAGCDCTIVVSGYNTRNGLVTNFAKG